MLAEILTVNLFTISFETLVDNVEQQLPFPITVCFLDRFFYEINTIFEMSPQIEIASSIGRGQNGIPADRPPAT